jgi:hypothetical protein
VPTASQGASGAETIITILGAGAACRLDATHDTGGI